MLMARLIILNLFRGSNSNVGAVVTFVGYVRDFEKKDSIVI